MFKLTEMIFLLTVKKSGVIRIYKSPRKSEKHSVNPFFYPIETYIFTNSRISEKSKK